MLKNHFFKRGPVILLLILFASSIGFAQTRSRIAGTVKEAGTGDPLAGANVMIEGTNLGAATDLNGHFIIINVPVGKYTVRATMMGYETQVKKDLMVSLNRKAEINFSLSSQVLQGSEVVVLAEKDQLHVEVSNTQLVVSDVQLQDATGIREINSFLSKLPGVSENNGYLTIRGGSADQTGMMVNGLSYMNAAVGNAETSIPLSAVEQVSLLSGGYNAEYGNFRSGLINVTTKSGTHDGYHGTVQMSMDNSHIRRFGPSFYDPNGPALRPLLDPNVAFVGTEEAWKDNDYLREQHLSFMGWNTAAQIYNMGKEPEDQATPLDYYLLAAWMHMAEPDYEGLAELGYTVSDEHKKLFAEHKMQEDGSDWNFDGGFGGPVPLVGKMLGNATFYISNNSRERHYVMPVTRRSEKTYTTLATMKAQPSENLSLTFNGLMKDQEGISPIRPAWGDFPDASREGGFMPINNVKYVYKNPDYWYDQPFFPILKQKTMMGGLTVNHILNPTMFWELTLSALNIKNDTPTGNTRDNTILTYFGPFPVSEMPYGKMQYGINRLDGYEYPSYDALPGLSRRFRRKEGDLYDNTSTTQYRAKFELTSQFGSNHYAKAGFEYNYMDLDHQHWQKWNENYYNVYEFNYHRTPSQTGFFIQDQMSYSQIVANVGLRFDYYYGGGGKWPSGDAYNVEMFTPQNFAEDSVLFDYLEQGRSYIWDLWEAYDKEHPGFLKPIENHFTVSPRIGVSFPITVNSKFYFNYGHFRSNPPYSTMYLYRYRYTKNGLYDMANPNLAPPRTISYELGAALNVMESYVVKLSGYSKDVTGENGDVNYKNSEGIDYDFWMNNQYEDIQGFELNISKQDNSWINGWLNFNYMLKKSGLTGREEYTEEDVLDDREGLYEGQETRSLPIPQLNANVTFRSPLSFGPEIMGSSPLGGWNITFFAEWEAGDYFTWNPLDEPYVNDNMRWPSFYMVDLKIAKTFKVANINTTFYVDVSNVFNIKNSIMHRGYAFEYVSGQDLDERSDFINYMASLKLPEYDSPKYDNLREQHEGYYLPGDDKIGDLRSEDKPYINDPINTYWLYGQPRDIWFGLRFNF